MLLGFMLSQAVQTAQAAFEGQGRREKVHGGTSSFGTEAQLDSSSRLSYVRSSKTQPSVRKTIQKKKPEIRLVLLRSHGRKQEMLP